MQRASVKSEKTTQTRIINLFVERLGYSFLGDLIAQDNKNVKPELLQAWLSKQGYSTELIRRALMRLDQAVALGQGKILYEANRDVYQLLRYGIKVKEGAGETNQTIWLVDWKTPSNNHFYVAEEVSIKVKTRSALTSCSISTASRWWCLN